MQRINARGIQDMHFSGEHKTIDILQYAEDLPCRNYIRKHIPLPQPTDVQFHISKVSHVTTKSGLDGILDVGGFRGGEKCLLWWGLAVEDEDIRVAEQRFLEKTFPDRTPEQREMQGPFLDQFTTSPAFRRDKSRYGNFKFTLSLRDLLQMYGEQLCGGEGPVMRVYGTTVYKQEIMYTVIVHSPGVREFEKYPGLWESGDYAVCGFRNHNIVWKAQALSETIDFEAVLSSPSVIKAVPFYFWDERDKWFVWDHVNIAFHLPEGQTLRLDKEKLIQSLTACNYVSPFLGVKCVPKSYRCTCGRCRLPSEEAKGIVKQLKREARERS